MSPPNDPYKYFRIEARELLDALQGGLLELERGSPSELVVPRLLRATHTLKGAARVVKQTEIAELAHKAEELLSPFRAGGAATQSCIEEALGFVDRMAGLWSVLATPGAPGPAPAAPGSPGPGAASETAASRAAASEDSQVQARSDAEELEALLGEVSNACVRVESLKEPLEGIRRIADLAAEIVDRIGGGDVSAAGSLADELRSIAPALQRDAASAVEHLERELGQIRESTEMLRLVPAAVLGPPLERATRDAARMSGKRVKFELRGGDARLDAGILAGIRGALIQAIRNATAHGIEPEAERVRLGKPPSGSIVVEVVRGLDRATFRCTDDGRGIDFEAVRRLLERKGAPAAETRALQPGELLKLLLGGGITTSGAVTEIAGRGIGMDVVRETAARLGGTAELHTEPGKGSRVELAVPVSLFSMRGLAFEAGGVAGLFPLDAVVETISVRTSDVARTRNGASVLHRGVAIPYLPLGRIFGARESASPASGTPAIVVSAGGSTLAAGVERLVGIRSAVVRPVPALAPRLHGIGGVALDDRGDPMPVFDPVALAGIASGGSFDTSEQEAPARPPVLVVDDSLTTRMLERSILESAGYEVDLAEDGERGIEMARTRRYGIFLVDFEMPGMDGVEFVRRTRADPELSRTPAILVTSRQAPEDRRRAMEAGAKAYIVKSEFDQAFLLDTLGRLMA